MKRPLSILLASLALSSCAFAVGGGAGYYSGAEDRTVGVIMDDAAITARINAAFVNDYRVSAVNINVDTYKGVVTLYGSVPSKASEARAISLAEGIGGVQRVVSKLTVVE